jgi:hypothetical protein
VGDYESKFAIKIDPVIEKQAMDACREVTGE